jgi:hypothetical protein
MTYAVYSAFGFLIFFLLLRFFRKRPLKPYYIEFKPETDTEPLDDSLIDRFYCILRKDGSSIGGYVEGDDCGKND